MAGAGGRARVRVDSAGREGAAGLRGAAVATISVPAGAESKEEVDRITGLGASKTAAYPCAVRNAWRNSVSLK
jgi:hypothetical protein